MSHRDVDIARPSGEVPVPGWTVSVVMPALNEEGNLADAIRDIRAVLPAHFRAWEVIVVDDGSTDRTGEIAETFARSDPSVRVLHNRAPTGLGAVFRRGVEAARHERVIYVPGDNALEAASLGAIFREAGRADVVVGDTRNMRVRRWPRRLISRCTTLFLNFVSGLHLPYYNGLALYHREDLLRLPVWSSSFAYQGEILMQRILNGSSYLFVPVLLREAVREKESKAFRWKNILGVLRTFGRLVWIVRVRGRFRNVRAGDPVAVLGEVRG